MTHSSNMSVDKADGCLIDGMTDELLNVLAQMPGLRVPGRSSSFAFKGKTEDNIVRKVGVPLHLAAVLEGSVRKAGDKLRITTQFSIGSFGHALAVSGGRAKAEQFLCDLENLATQRYVSPAARMVVDLGLGEKEKALEWLEKCYEDRDPQCWPLKVEPIYDSLRTEPRFQALLETVDLDK